MDAGQGCPRYEAVAFLLAVLDIGQCCARYCLCWLYWTLGSAVPATDEAVAFAGCIGHWAVLSPLLTRLLPLPLLAVRTLGRAVPATSSLPAPEPDIL